MIIRRARVDEAGPIAAVWLRSRTASAPDIPAPAQADDEVRIWFEEVVLSTKEVWVAEDTDAIVALLVLEEEWIDQLYVDPDRVGQGVGELLMAIAKEQHPDGLKLWTFAANAGARRFYERHGFVATASTEGDNEEGAPDIRYEWPKRELGPAP